MQTLTGLEQEEELSHPLIDSPIKNDLELKLEAFSEQYRSLLETYVLQAEQSVDSGKEQLFTFNAWNMESKDLPFMMAQDKMSDHSKAGFFIRWDGYGIAVNPGIHLLEILKSHQLSILDIDAVILTHSKRELYSGAIKLWDFNSQLNRVLGKQHPIHFYFNRSAYQEMIQLLKPQYRQEKSTLHCLELYLDTPDIEIIPLSDHVRLHYFQTNQAQGATEGINLGIKLELKNELQVRTIGYLSGTAWSPSLAHSLKQVDVLMTGFGTTSSSDLIKEQYQNDCLGYFGSLSLFEELTPPLGILSEFDQKIAGARLEICKQMRNELFEQSYDFSVLLADTHLEIDLSDLTIQCTATGSWTNPAYAKIVQGKDPFGPLQFLSPESYI